MKRFWKNFFFTFIMIQAGITLAMGIMGLIFLKGTRVPYEAFFLPFFFALLCMIPTLIFETKREPGIKETIIRKCCRFISQELIVLTTQKLLAPGTSTSLLIALGISVFVIAVIIQFINWLYAKSETDAMNRKLSAYHKKQKNAGTR